MKTQTPQTSIVHLLDARGRRTGCYQVGHLVAISGVTGTGPFGLVDLRALQLPPEPPKATIPTETAQQQITWQALPIWCAFDGCTQCGKKPLPSTANTPTTSGAYPSENAITAEHYTALRIAIEASQNPQNAPQAKTRGALFYIQNSHIRNHLFPKGTKKED